MDEKQWLASVNPRVMLLALTDRERMPGCVRLGKASERKLRLFACAAFRRLIGKDNFPHDRGNAAAGATAAEAIADGAPQALASYVNGPLGSRCWSVLHASAADAAVLLATETRLRPSEAAPQSELVRCIFGNPWKPYRPPGPNYRDNGTVWALGPAHPWLVWNSGLVKTMAQAIYDERTFDQLPILADALEEAGCTNQDILGHCRSGGEHARGCWVLDLILGKN